MSTANTNTDAVKEPKKSDEKIIKLPSGKTAVIGKFKGKHVMEAQRVAGSDQGKILFAIMAAVVKIDGNPVVLEDFDEMDGMDCLKLMAEFSTENF